MLQYKGYTGTVDLDPEENVLHGRVLGTRDVITYVSPTAEGLQHEFTVSIDDYLASCNEDGVEPNKPYSGTFNLRLGPQLHGRVALAAEAIGVSINDLVKSKLAEASLFKSAIAVTDRLCPFCGAQKEIQFVCAADHTVGGTQAECTNCGARGPIYPTNEDAATGWERHVIY